MSPPSHARTSRRVHARCRCFVNERFGGSWDDLRAARAATRLPLLAKGFFSTPDDLMAARVQALTRCS